MPTEDTYTTAVTANLAALASGLYRASTLAQMARDACAENKINLAIGTILPLKDELPMLHGLLTAAIALRHQIGK